MPGIISCQLNLIKIEINVSLIFLPSLQGTMKAADSEFPSDGSLEALCFIDYYSVSFMLPNICYVLSKQ